MDAKLGEKILAQVNEQELVEMDRFMRAAWLSEVLVNDSLPCWHQSF